MDLPALDLQSPNVLGSYLQGAQGGQALAMMPYQMQQAQQQTAAGALNLDQLRLALQYQKMRMGFMGGIMGQLTGQGSPSAGRTGGIQNGPQDAVAGTAAPGPDTSGSRSGTPLTGPTQASGSYDGSMGGTPQFDTGQAGFSPEMRLAIGALDPEMLKGIEGAEQSNLKKAQLQAQPALDAADAAITSPNPERLVMNNPNTYGAAWQQFGKQLGLDTSDPRTMTPENVRAAAVLYRNSIAAQVGLPATPMPAQVSMVRGPYGQLLGVTHGGTGAQGATTEIAGQKLPGYSMQDLGWDPATGQQKRQLMQTSPGGLPAPVGGSGAPPTGSATSSVGAGLGTTVGPQLSSFKQPSDSELKSAMFAGEFRSGNETMSALEGQGFRLSPSVRTIAVNMATEEDPGAMKQLLSQEVAARKLSENEKSYLAAMMPMLQAAGHDQSGARLTTAQIRQNLESLVPFSDSSQSLTQIQKNRQGFYTGLLSQAGPATQLPQYRDTLASDLKDIQTQASAPVTKAIGGKTYYKVNGRWFDNAQGK